MKGSLRLGVCWLLLLVTAVAGAAERAEAVSRLRSAYDSILARDLKRHAHTLADDTYEGREAGSRGGYGAGKYLVREFARLGLKPIGDHQSYYQAFGSGYRNILGLLPGSDPQLKDEIIVVGAHYDHVGYGTAQNSFGPTGYIHNGADDNASGTAALLELAEAITLLTPPRRSVLFALWDAEEKGLLGSQHWVSHPTLPLANVRMKINMDMVGRLRDNRLEIFGSRTSWGQRQLIARHNHQQLELDFSWTIEENSDHYPFYARSIPYLMFHTGLHEDYHRPSDDAEKLNFDGMQKIARLMLGVIDELANADQLPGFRAASRRENAQLQAQLAAALPPLPGRLGIHWNRSKKEAGIVVTIVVPDSAAHKAGLVPGDRIVAFHGTRVKDGTHLIRLVQQAPQQTVVTIERNGENLQVPLALEGSPIRVGISWRMDEAEPGAAMVTRIVPHSPAAAAGVAVGDYVQQVAGQTFNDDDELHRLFSSADSPLELLIERDGLLHTLRLDVAPLDPASDTLSEPEAALEAGVGP